MKNFIRIEDKEVYITKDKLENYYKGNFSDVIQYNNPNNENMYV